MRIIAGRWRGHRIQAPPGDKTRPTTDRVREAWMSALLPELPGARVLDLFAGSGAVGLEALSRGAAHVTFVDKAAGPLKALRANVERLGAGPEVQVIKGDALEFARRLAPDAFDVALADPPYGKGLAAELVRIFLEGRFAASLWVEHRRNDPLPDAADARTRRYGDTLLTTLRIPDA